MADRYRIVDEPQPGSLTQLAVAPFWPLLALMLGGAWLAWPWFAVNGLAVGSATRRREIGLVIGALVVSVVIAATVYLLDEGTSEWVIQLFVLALQIVKLGFGYALFNMQARSFGLFEYFGGTRRNGMFVVLAGAFLRAKLLGAISDHTLLLLVLA